MVAAAGIAPADAVKEQGAPRYSDVKVTDVDNGRIMNHSLRPNTDFRVFDKGYAVTDIAEGDEITSNYHEFDPGVMGFMPGLVRAQLDTPLHANGR